MNDEPNQTPVDKSRPGVTCAALGRLTSYQLGISMAICIAAICEPFFCPEMRWLAAEPHTPIASPATPPWKPIGSYRWLALGAVWIVLSLTWWWSFSRVKRRSDTSAFHSLLSWIAIHSVMPFLIATSTIFFIDALFRPLLHMAGILSCAAPLRLSMAVILGTLVGLLVAGAVIPQIRLPRRLLIACSVGATIGCAFLVVPGYFVSSGGTVITIEQSGDAYVYPGLATQLSLVATCIGAGIAILGASHPDARYKPIPLMTAIGNGWIIGFVEGFCLGRLLEIVTTDSVDECRVVLYLGCAAIGAIAVFISRHKLSLLT